MKFAILMASAAAAVSLGCTDKNFSGRFEGALTSAPTHNILFVVTQTGDGIANGKWTDSAQGFAANVSGRVGGNELEHAAFVPTSAPTTCAGQIHISLGFALFSNDELNGELQLPTTCKLDQGKFTLKRRN